MLRSSLKQGIITLLVLPAFFHSQPDWTWVGGGGAFTANQVPVFGTQGVAAPGNTPGNSAHALRWTDNAGNFWLYGGRNNNSVDRGEFWKYSPLTKEWTWISGPGGGQGAQAPVYGTQGVAAPSNDPGSRVGAATWTDNAGNLWLFGGVNFMLSGRSDLWKYDISTGMWTWMNGPSGSASTTGAPVYGTQGVPSAATKPPAGTGAPSWKDANGDFWLFGGFGADNASNYGLLNDLWKYTLSTNQWTWVKGSAAANHPGDYGTLNVAAGTNVPAGRSYSSGWISGSGELYLFGGETGTASINDLWKFNISTGSWTWIGGSAIPGQSGVYGTQGTASALNMPGARSQSYSWKDQNGDFWLFGGVSTSSSATSAMTNDLWKYLVSGGLWTWMKGSSTTGQAGIYGTQGVPAAANTPGARSLGASWTDNAGDLWLFSGITLSMSFMPSDMWKISPSGGTTTTVGITEERTSQVWVHPNPAETRLNIETAGQSQPIVYQLFDSKGLLVRKGEITAADNSIFVEDLNDGLYLLQLYTGGKGGVSKRIIIN